MRVLVTRPEPEASMTATKLAALGHEPVVAPLFKVEPIDPGPISLAGIGSVAVTSPRAVPLVAARAEWPLLAALPVFAVGTATAERARKAGAREVIAAEGTLDRLVRTIAAAQPPGRVLYLAGAERSGDLVAELGRHGLDCRMVEVYRSVAVGELPLEVAREIGAGRIDAALAYSRRSAAALAAALARIPAPSSPRFIAISEAAAGPLQTLGPVDIAAEPSEAGLFALLKKPC